MADNRKLAQGLMMMTPAMREDLAGREQDIQRGKTVELLRRAGKEMYENPVVNTAVGLSPVLGDIQAGVEAYRSAEAGDWGNAGLNAAGMLPFIPMLGKTVWHGSPHTFDKFDMSKIGTGEGAQAYGHGLYLAEAKPTAQEYQRNLAAKGMSIDGVPIESTLENYNIQQLVGEHGQNLSTLKEKLIDYAKQNTGNPYADTSSAEKIIQAIEKGSFDPKGGGSLYKVDLPDEQIAKMLDWDKPLTEQPEHIQEFVRNMDLTNAYGRNKGAIQAWKEGRDVGYIPKGQDVYNAMAGGKENDALASALMYQQGIPGIQYLDQASRGAGDGTRNYVVFSDEIPQILERNNQVIK